MLRNIQSQIHPIPRMENAIGFPIGIARQFLRLRIPGAGLVSGRDKACLVSTIVAKYNHRRIAINYYNPMQVIRHYHEFIQFPKYEMRWDFKPELPHNFAGCGFRISTQGTGKTTSDFRLRSSDFSLFTFHSSLFNPAPGSRHLFQPASF